MSTIQYQKSSASKDGSDCLLSYAQLNFYSLAYGGTMISAATQPLVKPYLYLASQSGDTGHGAASYFVTTVQIPQSGDSFGFVRRVIMRLRWTAISVPAYDMSQLTPDQGQYGPHVVIANLSNNQKLYCGFKPKDFYASYTEATTAHVTVPFGAVREFCLPFYANPNDTIEICLVSPATINHQGVVDFQLANFDIPTYDKIETLGWLDAAL